MRVIVSNNIFLSRNNKKINILNKEIDISYDKISYYLNLLKEVAFNKIKG